MRFSNQVFCKSRVLAWFCISTEVTPYVRLRSGSRLTVLMNDSGTYSGNRSNFRKEMIECSILAFGNKIKTAILMIVLWR